MDSSVLQKNTFVPSELYEILAKIATTNEITASERSILGQAFLEDNLTEEEHRLVNRLHRSLLKGRIKLV
ncbi:MAG TPA: hypothetical protein V6D28_27575 [Leptolyngbyaceae cyanobacterium]